MSDYEHNYTFRYESENSPAGHTVIEITLGLAYSDEAEYAALIAARTLRHFADALTRTEERE